MKKDSQVAVLDSKMNFEEFVEFYNSPKYQEWLDSKKDKCLHCIHRTVCVTQNDEQVRREIKTEWRACRAFTSEVFPPDRSDHKNPHDSWHNPVTPEFIGETEVEKYCCPVKGLTNMTRCNLEFDTEAAEGTLQWEIRKILDSNSACSSDKKQQKK